MFGTIFVTLTFSVVKVICEQPTLDPGIMSYLGDHGDRITDLETTVRTMQTGYAYFQREMLKSRAEIMVLQHKIQDLEASCYNNTNACCPPCPLSEVVSSTVTPYTTAPPGVPTTVHGLTTTTSGVPPTTFSVLPDSTTKTGMSMTSLQYPTTQQPSTQHPTTTTTTQSTTPSPETTTPSPSTTTTTTEPTTTAKRFMSCAEATAGGPGVYPIAAGSTTVDAYCENEWMIIQRRFDGSEDFNRFWQDYAQGFGDLTKEFWLGNENIYAVTNSGDFSLRIEFDDWAHNKRYVEYEHFLISDATDNYRLQVGSYSGVAGDSFHYPQSSLLQHHGMPFSTPDRDNDNNSQNCAKILKSGWWFNSCYSSNLNGEFLPSAYGHRMLGETYNDPTLEGTGIEWYPYRHRQYSMKSAIMKIRPMGTGSLSPSQTLVG